MQRYTGETERLVGILDHHLENTDYLVGNKYSIADIASFGWINGLLFAGVDLDFFPNVKAWWKRIHDRPAVQRGLSVPRKGPFGNQTIMERLESEPEFAKSYGEFRQGIAKAKEQYGYQYASP